jgi:hypothetical protein
MNVLMNNTMKDAVIHLKDGKKKHGLLMAGFPENENYFFIPNNSIPYFSESNNPAYIEVVPGTLIEAIETDLK